MMAETAYITHNTCFRALPRDSPKITEGEERKKNLWSIKENE